MFLLNILTNLTDFIQHNIPMNLPFLFTRVLQMLGTFIARHVPDTYRTLLYPISIIITKSNFFVLNKFFFYTSHLILIETKRFQISIGSSCDYLLRLPIGNDVIIIIEIDILFPFLAKKHTF